MSASRSTDPEEVHGNQPWRTNDGYNNKRRVTICTIL